MEVDRFLDLRFNETAPRPPIPGEENELVSNGGTSTRSTGSHKTQSSGKSEKSSKSRSPAATPRRSNLDKTGGSLTCSNTKLNGDEEAPLGFEPEGSEECANSPPFTENTTPPYKKWAENLKYLLADGEGVKLYKNFLDQEHTASSLDFHFACVGLKLVQATDIDKITSLSKLIYKKYIKGDQLKLDPQVKRAIAEKLRGERYSQSIFDEAQSHVENVMRKDTYPLFLNSDIYVQYVQNGGESPKSSHSTSGSNSVRPMSTGPLPTVHEEKELQLQHEDFVGTKSSILPLTLNTLAATQDLRVLPSGLSSRIRASRHDGISCGGYSRRAPVPPPYHVTYAPTSERDSENTSDAHTTDDAMSHTDSSIDGRDVSYCRRWKKKDASFKREHLRANLNTGQLIPRTDRAPKDRNMAEKNPQAFALMLIEKLERVVEERAKYKTLQDMCLDGVDEVAVVVPITNNNKIRVSANNNNAATSSLLLQSLLESKEEADDENAQSILEEHCNRIGWDISRGETPTGRHSPDQSLLLKGPNVSAVLHNSLNVSNSCKPHKKKDTHSLVSFDSGVVDDHHRHSHSRTTNVLPKTDVSRAALPAYYSQNPGHSQSQSFTNTKTTLLYDDMRGTKESSSSSRHTKRSSADNATVADSGFNDVGPLRGASQHEPSTQKVLAWMLENEKITSTNLQYSTDGSDKGSSLRHSHKSGSSKKSGHSQYSANRSLDHSKYTVYPYHSASVLPCQPIVQDPSMPLLNPPNTSVQLEEARRRLQDEHQHMSKSKSFTAGMVGSSRQDDKHLMPPPPIPPRATTQSRHMGPLPPQPVDMSQSSLDDNTHSRTEKLKPPPAPESIVVGYYFCNDPIPYRTTVPTSFFTLSQFKNLLAKKGNFRYFFKKTSDEFDTGIVYEEVTEDGDVLPLIEGKIIGKVEKVE